MTLFRQLLSFTLALCFILFVGVCIDKVHSTKTFLEHQLASHAQDTATSLGLSLSPFVSRGDLATVDTMMNAIFDRGYYRSIVLRDVNQHIISQRRLDVVIDRVPAWFIRLIPLTTPEAEALVMDGWKQAGTLHVASHPGYAYTTLWQTAVVVTVYFLLTGMVVFVLGGIGLHVLLRPLRRVEKQAEAICRNTYELQQRIPRTRELQQVVVSMNKMTAKVKEMFEEQAAIAEKLREYAFADPLTGLGNRRFLAGQVSSAMMEHSAVVKGAFVLVHVHDLQEINIDKGYNAGDELLTRVARLLKTCTTPWSEAIITRISGGDFALFLPNLGMEEGKRLAESIAASVPDLVAERFAPHENVCSIGGVVYHQPTSLEHLLAAADEALGEARLAGPNQNRLRIIHPDTEDTEVHGKKWWQDTLEKALATQAVNIYTQRVVSTADQSLPLHREIYSRIALGTTDEINASIFIPMAEQSGLIEQLDRQVIETVLNNRAALGPGDLAINISAKSILNSAFVDWLIFRLAHIPPKQNRLFFEIPEFYAVQHIEVMRTFSQAVRKSGHGTALDHFGRSFGNFGHLMSLRPEYVKIDAAFTRELTTHINDSYFFISALKSVARSLDIKVIAEGVENQEQHAILQELAVDGLGGYLIDQPSRLHI